MTITEQLADFTASLRYHDLLPEVVARTRLLVLDLIGIAVRARRDAESTPALIAAVRAMGLGNGHAHVFADADTYAPIGAALVNGVLAHSLDFDDTHAAAIVHPGAPVITAALAAAELNGASGKDTLAAIVAGYEVALRLSLALPAGAHYDRGFHPTATCGAFGASAAASRVLGLDTAAIESAFGIVLSQSVGSLQFLANGAWTKRFQVGWAGMAGFSAALLAREGFRGAADPIEGKHGFLNAHAPAPTPERAVEQLGTVWELMRTAVKPYPSCRWGHAGIDAALELRAEHHFDTAKIEQVTLGLSHAGMQLIGEPAEQKRTPRNVVEAQFSGPFVIAVALATGKMTWDSYKRLNDPAVRRLMQRISCVQDREIEAEFPANMAGKLTLRYDGQTFVRKVVTPKGEPETFPSETELRDKFANLADEVLGKERASELAATALGLDQLPNAAALLRAGMGLRTPPRQRAPKGSGRTSEASAAA